MSGTYDTWKTRDDQADEDRPPDENDVDFLQYRLQRCFEDLCGRVGFEDAYRFVIQTMVEHHEMLKRQGRAK